MAIAWAAWSFCAWVSWPASVKIWPIRSLIFLMRGPVNRRLPGGGQLGPQPLRLAQRAGQLLFQVGDLAASVFGEIVDVAPSVATHRDVEHFAGTGPSRGSRAPPAFPASAGSRLSSPIPAP